MNLKENLPSRPATDAPGFAGNGITANPRSGFGRAFAWLLLAFALLAPAAQAANITKTFSFVATYPSARVTGSFTVTFDPSVSVNDQAANITVNSLSIPYQGALVFPTTLQMGF